MKFLFATAFLALSACAQAADLDIDVQGLASSEGSVMVAVFADSASWLRKPAAVALLAASARKGGTLHLLVKDVPEGSVAVSLFHDQNGNGQLDKNAMGMPIEPFGFSRDAVGQFGPPKFEQASFELKGGARSLSIKLN